MVTLAKRSVCPGPETSSPKYLVVLDELQIRLFIVFGIVDLNDLNVRLSLLEQKAYVQRIFNTEAILADADNIVDQLIRWNDLNFL